MICLTRNVVAGGRNYRNAAATAFLSAVLTAFQVASGAARRSGTITTGNGAVERTAVILQWVVTLRSYQATDSLGGLEQLR